jgi:hypothetical protein
MIDDTIEDLSLDERLAQLRLARAELYYAITLTADDDSKIIFLTQSQWAGWSDADRLIEIRKARLVYPSFVQLWEGLGQPYSIIHDASEAMLFILGGGNALVEKALAERIFSQILNPDTVVRDGKVGFKSHTMLPASAFKRAPSPKLRMKVFKRDDRRCRICGRRPDDHVDVELHVHHIRPWSKGGTTDIANLITLCQTCHKGLEPHQDHSLFDYLEPNNMAIEAIQLKNFLKGVANYRKVGFTKLTQPS